MAFDINNFDKLSAQGLTELNSFWGYISLTDNTATISVSGYFDKMVEKLHIGDRLLINATDGANEFAIVSLNPVVIQKNPNAVPDGTIVNSMISASAAISFSKLEPLLTGNIIVGSALNVPTQVTPSGDVNLNYLGVFSIPANSIGASKLALNALQYGSITISSSQFQNMYTTPVQVLASPGVGFVNVFQQFLLLMNYGTTTYTGGGNINLQYGNASFGAGPGVATPIVPTSSNVLSTQSTIVNSSGATATATILASAANTAVYISNQTGAFTTGNSTFKLYFWYRIVPST